VGDEGFNQFAARALQSFSAAEVGRVSLNKCRIEIVLADYEAKLIAEPRMAVVAATVVSDARR
jgi:hypothetical protein